MSIIQALGLFNWVGGEYLSTAFAFGAAAFDAAAFVAAALAAAAAGTF